MDHLPVQQPSRLPLEPHRFGAWFALAALAGLLATIGAIALVRMTTRAYPVWLAWTVNTVPGLAMGFATFVLLLRHRQSDAPRLSMNWKTPLALYAVVVIGGILLGENYSHDGFYETLQVLQWFVLPGVGGVLALALEERQARRTAA